MREARLDKLLSAYIDDKLGQRERAQLEQQLKTNVALQRRLDALQEIVALVHGMPVVRVPRNFILTPADVGEPEHNRTPATGRWAASLLTAATTVTSLLFVLVLAIDLLPIRARVGSFAPAPAMEPQMEAPRAVQEEKAAEVVVEEVVVEKEEPIREQPEALEKAVPQENLSGEAVNQDVPAPETEIESPAEMPAAEEELSAGATSLSADPTDSAWEPPAVADTVPATPEEGSQTLPVPELAVGAVSDEGLESADAVTFESLPAIRESAPSFRGIPVVAIQVGLGIGSLILFVLTIRAWHGRRR